MKEMNKYLTNKDIKRITGQQNKALRLFCRQLSEHLNMAGLGVKKVLKPSVEIDWNEKLAMEYLWRPLQEAITGKKSTTELSKVEDIDKIYDHINRHLGEKFGFETPPFPSIEMLMEKEQEEKDRQKRYEDFKNDMSEKDKKTYNKIFNEKS